MLTNTWAREMMRHAPRRTRTKNAHHFGPGRLESLTLYERTGRNPRRHQYRIEGTFTVYCGNGWDHSAYLNGMWADVRSLVDYGLDDITDVDRIADILVEWELEDWFDPCETQED